MRLTSLFIPGLVFQAVVMGGGYATGRELVEFFMQRGLASGVLGIVVTAGVWSAVLAITFAWARRVGTRDYRTFLKTLIGPLWVGYEICFVLLLLLVLSVLGSASGEIAHSRLGVASSIGTLGMMAGICLVVLAGTSFVERFLAAWSLLLLVLFALVLAGALASDGPAIMRRLQQDGIDPAAIGDGIRYAGYNLAVVPGILYVVDRLNTDREALAAGVLGGLIAALPALLFFIAMASVYPDVRDAPLPIDILLSRLDVPWLTTAFYVALFGVLIKTGAALLHALNERLAQVPAERGMAFPTWLRGAVAALSMAAAFTLAEQVGIIALVANGYAALTLAFLALFVVPVLTIGVYRLLRRDWRTAAGPETSRSNDA